MKKEHKFDELSSKICDEPSCGKKLKIRLVEGRLPRNITKCYKHYIEAEARRGHPMKKD